jgi:hypothetical protein
MRRIYLYVFLLILVSCNSGKDSATDEKQDSVSVAADTVVVANNDSSDFDATPYAKLKSDSLKYLFDRYDQNHNYYYTIQSLKVKRLGGQAIFQGDIILESNVPDNSRLKRVKIDTFAMGLIQRFNRIQMVGVDALSGDRMWPGGVVNYRISSYGSTDNLKPSILHAIDAWKASGLKFKEVTSLSGDYILFEAKPDYEINASELGRVHGKQVIQLRPDASTGNIIHEIGHSLGLWHEHSRFDRDQFITIQDNNIDPNCKDQFELIKDKYSFYETTYDYASIMHYDAYAFAKTGSHGQKLTTITTKPPGKSIGQRNGLSAGDLAGIKRMYHL